MRHALRLPEMGTANLLIGPPFHLSSPFPPRAALSFPSHPLASHALRDAVAVEKAAGNTILVTWHTDTERRISPLPTRHDLRPEPHRASLEKIQCKVKIR